MSMAAELSERTTRWTPAWLKELVRKGATRVGCQLGRLPAMESLGQHLREVFAELQITCVLDVGAHVGQYGRFLRNIGYEGQIVSFEPIQANFAALLQRSAGDRRWTALRMALGNHNAIVPMNVAHVTQFSSFLSPNQYSLDRFDGFSHVDRVEMVEMKRLDVIFDACVAPAHDARVFLKLDTQGYDLNVLEGAGSCLDRTLGLQSELSVKPLYEGMTGYITAMSSLHRMGFDLTGVFPVLRDEHLRIVEFDSVMVKAVSPGPGAIAVASGEYAVARD
jgi:FkbM family methyltransferase